MSEAEDILYDSNVILAQENIDLRAEIERLRAFHEAWVGAEVAVATGSPEIVMDMRKKLLAAHKAVRAFDSKDWKAFIT
jgi:hypothetical protein